MKLTKHIAIGVLAVSATTIMLNTNVEATTAVVDVESLYLREKASAESDMVDGLVRGQELEVIEKLDGWYKVKADGETGYVSADYVKVKGEEAEEKKETEPETAKQSQEQPKEEQKQEENKPAETKKEETPKAETKKEFQTREANLVNDTKAYILPLINSNVLKELKSGAKVTILDEVNGWYYIQEDEINGWAYKTAFGEVVTVSKEENKEETKPEEKKETETTAEETKTTEKAVDRKEMYVNTDSINVRQGPDTTYDVVAILELNDKVSVVAENGEWYKVEFSNESGYIAKRLLDDKEQTVTSRGAEERTIAEQTTQTVSATTPSSKGEEIVEFAKQYLGCPYVYGGSGPDSFDCSGFTMYVFNHFGINFGHTAQGQARLGEYVAKEDLQPGDLVFFLDYETMDEIGHVGIYVGDGNFIHASSGTGYCVKISTLLSGSYDVRYDSARRVI